MTVRNLEAFSKWLSDFTNEEIKDSVKDAQQRFFGSTAVERSRDVAYLWDLAQQAHLYMVSIETTWTSPSGSKGGSQVKTLCFGEEHVEEVMRDKTSKTSKTLDVIDTVHMSVHVERVR